MTTCAIKQRENAQPEPNHTTIKTGAELRNVGDTAYAMSHAAAEACTVHTVAGCRAWHWQVSGDGYSAFQRLAAKPLVLISASSGEAASSLRNTQPVLLVLLVKTTK